MHVGIVCEHSDPARGGAERYLAQLADRLRAHGHAVTVRARTGPAAAEDRSPAHLRDAGADVVLATVPAPGCDFYQPHHGLYAVAIPAHYDPLPWGLRHLRRWNPLRRAHFARMRGLEARVVAEARVLALSPRMVEDLARLHPDARAVLCRPGVDLARFAPGTGGDGLLFVAHNFRLKGLRTALRALRRLPDRRLVVAGSGRPRPADRAAYVRAPVDLPALYRAADVLVHPTWHDTASLVVLEALASGTPAITTVRDGNADLAVAGGGAALPDPGDDAALARAIEEVSARADRARARAVAERFPEEAMLDRVVEALTCASSS